MTVGEKIQFYRKKIGLSQEELGQKLLVSRQTVSLWEMGKTLPTVDNLLLLKDIFSVSIDEILSETDPTEDHAPHPAESYVFQYEKHDLRAVFRKLAQPIIRRAVIFSVACAALLIFFALIDADVSAALFLLGYALYGIISHIKGYSAYKKTWLAAESRILQSTYAYEIFDGYFTLNISRNGEITQTRKVYFSDIEKIHDLGSYLVLQFPGQSSIMKKDALLPDSALTTFCQSPPHTVETKKPRDISKVISILLLVLSILTLWGALICVGILSGINKMMTENMWIFFLFTPIPLASVAFSFYLKKRGYKHKANLIVGVIMTPLLCLYGAFSFIFANVYSHDDEPILYVEKMLNMDIPNHEHINTQDWTAGSQSVPRGYIYFTSEIYFDPESVENFEESLPQDVRWMSSIPNDLIGITSYFYEMRGDDYHLIYNQDTGDFNRLPDESGTYRFIHILYDTENNDMILVEYQIDYAK